MRKIHQFFLSFSLPFLFSTSAFAAAFQFYELGTPVIGTAAVGQAVEASDASTAYFNPAGMTNLYRSQYMLGSQIILPYTYFSQSSRTTIMGDNGGSAGALTPGMSLFYVYNFSPCFKAGFSFVSPYGGAQTYNDGWAGRYEVQSVLFYTLNLNPSIAYQINDWAAIGLGASIEYANLRESVALPTPIPGVDGQVIVKADNFAPGLNVGLLFKPTATTKIGIAYRSRITHHLHGDITFLRLPFTPSATTSMVMPQNVIVSASQTLADKFVLLGELGWSAWSSMKDSVIHVDGLSATTLLNWSDTYRVGLAGQYHFNHALTLQAGASFDSSPTSAARRTPDLPVDRQIRVGAGLLYTLTSAAKLGFSYEYFNLGNANINIHSRKGNLVGSYARNYANVLQASINVDC
jgi:long-chain fatty acid transport protein